MASLLRTLDLPRPALAGGMLFEFASVAAGTAGWRPLLALIACPAFVAALERCISDRRPGIARLAVAVGLVCAFSQAPAASATFGFGLAWIIVRLASIRDGSRWRALGRVGLAAILGAVIASPIGAADLLSGAVRASLPWPSFLLPLGWHIATPGTGTGLAFDRLLPVIGLGCLALVPRADRAPVRGGTLRILLAATAALAEAALTPSEATPLCLTCLVVLCGVLWSDLAGGGRRRALTTAATGLAVLAGLAAFGRLRPSRPMLVVNVLGLAAALALSRRTGRVAVLSLPAITAAAYTAVANAS